MALTTFDQKGIAFDHLSPRPQRSDFVMATIAFLAILRRDLLVARRELITFLVQVLIQPLFLLFIFGKVLPSIGFASTNFGAIFLPGIVSFTIVLTALQGVTLPLVIDLGYAHEIDDRLLAPMPIQLVAIEKILFAALRSMIAGAVIFPLAFWILGSGYQVRGDEIGLLIGLMILAAFAGASLGLTIGTLIPPEQISLIFSVILTPMLFLGCTYYPWGSLGAVKWFQIITLLNPLTYASEGLRSVMVPTLHGYTLPTLGLGWVLLGLGVTIVLCFILGLQTFSRRVVN